MIKKVRELAAQRTSKATLRERAEAKAQSMDLDIHSTQTAEQIQKVMHELRVHQIELEMQNEELQRAQRTIEESRARYFDLYNLAPVGYFTISKEGLILEVNLTAALMLGIARSDLVQKPLSHFIFKADQDLFYLYCRKLEKTSVTQDQELRLLRPDGKFVWGCLTSTAAHSDDCAPVFRITVTDIAERKQAEKSLHLAASVFTSAREGIAITDPDGNILDVNAAFTDITGYSCEDLLEKNFSVLSSDNQSKGSQEAMWRDVLDKGHWYGELWSRRKDGEVFAEFMTITSVCNDRREVQNYIVLISDITVIKEQQSRLEYIAYYDALTNLPNRLLLSERLQQAMRQATRRGERLALVYLDLDGFKEVNDSHGHNIGDQVLVTVSRRMSEVLREGDSLARIGGDEFIAVLVDFRDVSSSIMVLERLLDAVARPISVDKLNLQLTVSLGVTFWPQEEVIDADQLIRQADQAMYQAKQAGRNRFHIFDAVQEREVRVHHEGIYRIRQALENREFVLYYQPKVNMRTGALLGVEALIRWQHPERGLLLPNAFLPLIEDNPLIINIGDWVLDAALTQVEAWHAEGLPVAVSVNVSALQLQQPDFVSKLRVLMDRFPGINPGDLEFEVLETSALVDFSHALKVMAACQDLGVGFALDDFGTGYSSLTYLKKIPAGLLKIDQGFVRDMLNDPGDLSILEGVLGLASAFKRQAIAEGVETVAHGEMLLRLGCEWGQGYAIARPMPAADFGNWISGWEPPPTWKALERVSSDRLPALSATVEHRAWTDGVVNYLSGKGDEPTAQDAHECRFGRWLDCGGRASLLGEGDEHDVDKLHRKLHEMGAAAIASKANESTHDVNAHISKLLRLRDQFIQKVSELY